jgi:hypothetical protein
VRHAEPVHVRADERPGLEQRYLAAAKGRDRGRELRALVVGERAPEEGRHLLEHVGVPRARGGDRVGGGEARAVLRDGVLDAAASAGRDEMGECLVVARAVREQRVLVRRVERDQPARTDRAPRERAPPRGGEEPLHEVRAPRRAPQPALFFQRHVGHRLGERDREEPVPASARRRPALQHVAVERERRQALRAPCRVRVHPLGEILAGRRDDQPRGAALGDEVDRRTRDPEAQLHLGADGDPLHVLAEDVGEERLALVPAVVPDVLAEQARGDADAEGRCLVLAHDSV